MNAVLSGLLVNSLFAGILALLAWVAWRRFACTPLAHGLLLLALLKLITPAFWSLEIPGARFDRVSAPSTTSSGTGTAFDLASLDQAGLARVAASLDAAAAESVVTWPAALLVAWVFGALAVAWTIRARGRRFALLLDLAESAPAAVESMARELARRAGLSRTPRVQVVDANLSPFVFHWGGIPTITLPRHALNALDARELRVVLAHEIGHIAQGDHWTRWLEIGVSIAHWWNPIAHWIRACVREVEEVRCDARAVALLESGSRHYGRTILKTTSFVDGDLHGLPLGASGLGGSNSMEKRLTMIANQKLSYRASLTARAALAIGAITFLPLGVSAQDAPRRNVSQEIRELRQEIDALRARLSELQRAQSGKRVEWVEEDEDNDSPKRRVGVRVHSTGEGEGHDIEVVDPRVIRRIARPDADHDVDVFVVEEDGSEPAPKVIRGRVVDPRGVGVDGAKVRAFVNGKRLDLLNGLSDEDGAFVIRIPHGSDSPTIDSKELGDRIRAILHEHLEGGANAFHFDAKNLEFDSKDFADQVKKMVHENIEKGDLEKAHSFVFETKDGEATAPHVIRLRSTKGNEGIEAEEIDDLLEQIREAAPRLEKVKEEHEGTESAAPKPLRRVRAGNPKKA